jgi:hypothetical protein
MLIKTGPTIRRESGTNIRFNLMFELRSEINMFALNARAPDSVLPILSQPRQPKGDQQVKNNKQLLTLAMRHQSELELHHMRPPLNSTVV